MKKTFAAGFIILTCLLLPGLTTSQNDPTTNTPGTTASYQLTDSSETPLGQPVLDVSKTGKHPLTPALSFIVDQTNTVTFEQAQTLTNKFKTFTDASTANPNKNYWFQFTLANYNDEPVERVLALNDILITNAELFYRSNNKEHHQMLGLAHPYDQAGLKHRQFSFRVDIPAHTEITYYLKLSSSFYLIFTPFVADPVNMIGISEKSATINFIMIGALIGVFLYIIIILFHTREFDNTLFTFSCFLLSSILLLLYLNGFLLPLLFNSPWLQLNAYNIFVAATAISFLVSCRQQFSHLPVFKYIEPVTLYAGHMYCALILASFFFPPEQISVYTVFFSAFVLLSLSLFCVLLLFIEKNSLPLLVFGNVAFLITTVISNLGSMGLFESPWISRHGFEIGLSLIGIFMALAVSDKIILYRRESTNMATAAASANARNEAKSRFLAKMSHEIRTPMNGVLGIVELLKESNLDSTQKHYIKLIEDSGSSLIKVINDILDYSKIEADKLEFENITFDLPLMLNDICNFYSSQSSNKKLTFESAISTDIPSSVVGDPVRIRQIITNLLSNALKFTSSGVIELKVNVQHIDNKECTLYFAITDTGIGVAQESLDTLFSSFVQADPSNTRNFGGTGLGLAICKQLVELMGGEIGAQSRINEGSCFWFTLSLALPDTSSISSNSDTSQEIGKTKQSILHHPSCVLVVEDNDINREVIQGMLERLNVNAEYVCNGKQAVDAYEHSHDKYSLILMDCEMPVMDGFSATKNIRLHEQEKSLESIPIIAITAHAIPGYKEKCLEAGMNDHIAKPVQRDELVKKLSHWSNQHCY